MPEGVGGRNQRHHIGKDEKNQLKASFMPKPTIDGSGSGLHVHISIWDQNNFCKKLC